MTEQPVSAEIMQAMKDLLETKDLELIKIRLSFEQKISTLQSELSDRSHTDADEQKISFLESENERYRIELESLKTQIKIVDVERNKEIDTQMRAKDAEITRLVVIADESVEDQIVLTAELEKIRRELEDERIEVRRLRDRLIDVEELRKRLQDYDREVTEFKVESNGRLEAGHNDTSKQTVIIKYLKYLII